MILLFIPLVVSPTEGFEWSRLPFSPYPRSKLDNQRLFLPRQIHLLIIPDWSGFITKLHIKVPDHTCKNKSRFEIPQAISRLDAYNAQKVVKNDLRSPNAIARANRKWLKYALVIRGIVRIIEPALRGKAVRVTEVCGRAICCVLINCYTCLGVLSAQSWA